MQKDGALVRLDRAAGDLVSGSRADGAAPGERRVPRRLSGPEKAAIVVRLLLNEGADLPLEELPEDLQARLTQQMARMGLIDRVTLSAVAAEFAEALDGIGLAFPNGLIGALTALDGKIAPQTAARLRREAGVRQTGDPWRRLRDLDVEDLAELALAESTEVAAVLLSKLDTARAAALLGALPGPDARRITYAVSRTDKVTPEAVDRIGWSLVAQLDMRPIPAFGDGPEKRIGDILNQSAAATRDQVLSALDEEDAGFATNVRKVLFTFADIPGRLRQRDVPAVVRAVPQDRLVVALAGATEGGEPPAVEFLLANISGRMADTLREEIAEKGPPKRADAEAAMTEVVAAIRTLEADGALELASPDEDAQDGGAPGAGGTGETG